MTYLRKIWASLCWAFETALWLARGLGAPLEDPEDEIQEVSEGSPDERSTFYRLVWSKRHSVEGLPEGDQWKGPGLIERILTKFVQVLTPESPKSGGGDNARGG